MCSDDAIVKLGVRSLPLPSSSTIAENGILISSALSPLSSPLVPPSSSSLFIYVLCIFFSVIEFDVYIRHGQHGGNRTDPKRKLPKGARSDEGELRSDEGETRSDKGGDGVGDKKADCNM